jgi:chromosome segregation ATPase
MDQATSAVNDGVPTPEEEEKLPEDVEQLKADIEATRAELTHTIDALQDKIDPRKAAHRVGDQALEKARETSEKVAETAKTVTHTISEKVGETAPVAAKTIQEKGTLLADKIRENPRLIAYAGAALGGFLVLVGINKSRH